MNLNIPMTKMLLPEATLAQSKPLLGFDSGEDTYHVLAFNFGDDGGAIGIWREGDSFCARITLDALVAFHQQAKATHVQGEG